MSQQQIISTRAEQTGQLGAALGSTLIAKALAASFAQPIVIFLRGELGAGKTTFVRGLLQSMGVTGAVRSPTYTLLEPYELPSIQLNHMDLYRVTDASELEFLALKDMTLPNTVMLIEWAERAEAALPKPDLIVSLRYSTALDASQDVDHRIMDIEGCTLIGESLCAQFSSAIAAS